jgi:hypothetical protein
MNECSMNDAGGLVIWALSLICHSSFGFRHLAEGFRAQGQMPFDGVDQLLNVDRFGEEWVSLDMETTVRLVSGDERSEKNDWRVLQFRIGSDLCRNFTSISVGHDYIKEDQIRPEIPSGLMSPCRVVFFEDQIAACLFEKNFNQVSRVFVVINNQNSSRRIAD